MIEKRSVRNFNLKRRMNIQWIFFQSSRLLRSLNNLKSKCANRAL